MKKYTFIVMIMLLSKNLFAGEPVISKDVIFQGFGWEEFNQPKVISSGGYYNYIRSKVDELKVAGFTMILMPSIFNSIEPTTETTHDDPKAINNSSVWGNFSDLMLLTTALKTAGVHPIADVEINQKEDIKVDRSYCIDNQATSDMNQTDKLIKNLNGLQTLGFEGWRLNVIKNTLSNTLKNYINTTPHYFLFGENWDTNESGVFKYSVEDSISTATLDYYLYYSMMQGAFDSGNWELLGDNKSMGGLVGVEKQAGKVVTFVDNVSTFNQRSNDNSSESFDKIMMGYAYILTHPGIPCIFMPHYYGGAYSKDGVVVDYGLGYKTIIDSLLLIRQINDIVTNSEIEVANNTNFYADYIYNRYGNPAVAVSIGANSTLWYPSGNDWKLAVQGNNYKVWAKKISVNKSNFNDKINNDINETLTVYPNPTSGVIKFSIENAQNAVITNTLGKVLWSDKVLQNNEIDISSYPKGIYIITITNKKGEKISKYISKQ